MNIKGKVYAEYKKLSYQFDVSMDHTNAQIVKEINKGKILLEAVDYITMGAKVHHDFYQNKFIEELFKRGFIKDDETSKLNLDEFYKFFNEELCNLRSSTYNYIKQELENKNE